VAVSSRTETCSDIQIPEFAGLLNDDGFIVGDVAASRRVPRTTVQPISST
jgi:hypothetical protein